MTGCGVHVRVLTLDEQYDKQATKLRKCIHRAEKDERQIRKFGVQLAEAKAQATEAQSREATAIEALQEAQDRHTQQLKDAYLVTRAKRRTIALEKTECRY